MKRVWIDVPCRLNGADRSRSSWIVMPGELLHDIAPHLAHVCTFAVCLSPCGAGIFSDYVVVSLETGLRVRGEYPTKGEAIAAARKVLDRIPSEYAAMRVNKERPEGE